VEIVHKRLWLLTVLYCEFYTINHNQEKMRKTVLYGICTCFFIMTACLVLYLIIEELIGYFEIII
jgi:hypothetical protein